MDSVNQQIHCGSGTGVKGTALTVGQDFWEDACPEGQAPRAEDAERLELGDRGFDQPTPIRYVPCYK